MNTFDIAFQQLYTVACVEIDSARTYICCIKLLEKGIESIVCVLCFSQTPDLDTTTMRDDVFKRMNWKTLI